MGSTGFEPVLSVLETLVLPLHHEPKIIILGFRREFNAINQMYLSQQQFFSFDHTPSQNDTLNIYKLQLYDSNLQFFPNIQYLHSTYIQMYVDDLLTFLSSLVLLLPLLYRQKYSLICFCAFFKFIFFTSFP